MAPFDKLRANGVGFSAIEIGYAVDGSRQLGANAAVVEASGQPIQNAAA